MPNLPPKSKPHHQSRPGYQVEGWCSAYQGPSWPPHGWDSCSPPVLQGSGSPQFPCQPMKRRRHRQKSSSSSYTTSSSYSSSSSSYSSNTSDSDDSEYRRRDKKRIKRSKKERCGRVRDEEQRRRKQHRRERENNSEERRREESGESDQERRRKKQKHDGKQRRKEKKSREEDFEVEGGERVMDSLKPEDTMDSNKCEVHVRTEMCVEQGNGGQDEPAKPKYRKEKKKMKEKVDTRTEEEKLWDDSILGC